MRRVAAVLALGWTLAALLPAHAANKHLGPANCSSGACHGKVAADTKRNVPLNEHTIWRNNDHHSRAYRTLQSAESQAIATRLGLQNATGARICLDCHAGKVQKAEQGPKFQFSDGVGCEACHGPSELWIDSHTTPTSTHRDNLDKGMYPLDQAVPRAQKCLSCHLGTKDAFTTHQILGAGHPRLRFELETFTSNQSDHYVIDADYRRRKGEINGTTLWLTGQFESARQYVALLQSPLYRSTGLPELALYDCHSCHAPTSSRSWTPARVGAGLAPGGMRLNRGNLSIVGVAARVLGTDADAQDLASRVNGLMRAVQGDPAQVGAASGRVLDWFNQRRAWLTRSYVAETAAKLRTGLLQLAASDGASDYAIAEQVVMGIDSLSHTLNDSQRVSKVLKGLDDALVDESAFDPARFAQAARVAQATIK